MAQSDGSKEDNSDIKYRMDGHQASQKTQSPVRKLFARHCEQKSKMNLGNAWGWVYRVRLSDRLNVGHQGHEALEDNV